VASAKMADFGNTQRAARGAGHDPGAPWAIASHPSEAPTPEQSGTVRGTMSGTLVSRGFDGWVSAYVDLAAVREPLRRWHPHPSTPLMRRRAPLAPDERE
jgi:hypothetical protein